MIQIDLITGFLGAGKTTFIKKYVHYLAGKGQKVGIVENDFGAVNVDLLMLQELPEESCEVEQIVGGKDVEDWKRRFRSKLIAMAMQGFERIIVEPSGIFDVDAFFDVLYDEPLDRRYEVGNIYAIVDPAVAGALSEEEEYLLVSQLANAGAVVVSKIKSGDQVSTLVTYLQEVLERFRCRREFHPELDVCAMDWEKMSDWDWEQIAKVGYRRASYEKLWFSQKEIFQTIAILDLNQSILSIEEREKKLERISQLFSDVTLGNIRRVKGFFQIEEGKWLQVNATKGHLDTRIVSIGQEVLLVIGRDLNESRIREFLQL